MRRTVSPARMSTSDHTVRVDDASAPPEALPSGNQSRLGHQALRTGAALALIVFGSFCVLWVQWQMDAPRISLVSGDFIGFWTAGELTLEGRAADAYDAVPHFFKEVELHRDPDTWAYVSFFYPPYFLLLCAGLALLPYVAAVGLWLASTCAAYAAAMRALVPKDLRDREAIWVLFLGYPAALVNAGFGQNGFLSTALLGGAAVWLDRRPVLAGLCFGCLSYKPQLGIVVPLALAVAGRWRCFAAAAITVVVLAAAATLAFGVDIWPAFFADMSDARRNWMEAYNPLYLRFWITVFGFVRLHDGPLLLAYGAQLVVSIIAISLLVRAFLLRPPGARSGTAEVAAIAACIPFCSPFMLEYDLMVLAVPMIWLLCEGLRHGFQRGEGIALAAAFAAPILFKFTVLDNAMKLSAMAAATLLFAMVLRRMTQSPRDYQDVTLVPAAAVDRA
ncbi:MAG TPA: glycosyltransferase family 87 protein [Bradyrhizobium sp.]|nr:glycosyltransferase family 87 protein [Bradyrhizobium sp.]